MKTYAALPMMFEANNGQTDPHVKFLSHAAGYTLFLTDKEAVLSLPTGSPASALAHTGPHSRNSVGSHLEESEAPKPTGIVRLKFAGDSAPAAISGRDQLPGKTNYLIGNDPKQWHTNVPNYDGVVYRNVYPGVDAVFHGDDRRLEFDFIVAPDANPHAIALEVEGGENNLCIGPAGEVIVTLGQHQHGETDAIPESRASITLLKPVVYQETAGKRHDIQGKFTLLAENKIGFALGTYDRTLPLVIDPTLEYSTYVGPVTTVGVAVAGIGVDAVGNTYIAGTVDATNYPPTLIAGRTQHFRYEIESDWNSGGLLDVFGWDEDPERGAEPGKCCGPCRSFFWRRLHCWHDNGGGFPHDRQCLCAKSPVWWNLLNGAHAGWLHVALFHIFRSDYCVAPP
jgi:hypothetical protein